MATEEKSEDSLLQEDPPEYMQEADSLGEAPVHCETGQGSPLTDSSTFLSKLKLFCPSLYFSLSLLERNAFECSGWPYPPQRLF
jgi:hypothetical protein